MAVRLSALRAGRTLPSGRFLVLISVKRLSRAQGRSEAGKIRSIEKSSIGNGTCDLPAYSIVPQPTKLPRAPVEIYNTIAKYFRISLCNDIGNGKLICVHYPMQAYRIATSALDGGKWSASRHGEKVPVTHWIGG
jgi:hypothetical protein